MMGKSIGVGWFAAGVVFLMVAVLGLLVGVVSLQDDVAERDRQLVTAHDRVDGLQDDLGEAEDELAVAGDALEACTVVADDYAGVSTVFYDTLRFLAGSGSVVDVHEFKRAVDKFENMDGEVCEQ